MFLEGLGRVDIVNRNQTFASVHFVMYHRISVIRYEILAEFLSYNMTA